MKLVQINVVCNGSTGKIMCDIAKTAEQRGFETTCFYGRGLPNKNVHCVKIGNNISIKLHGLLARLGFNGHGSYFLTKRLVKNLKKINPDIIHLHNLHGYYINLKVLFKYLKGYNRKIIWTLHDCWPFTGHCCYFTIQNCNKWKKCCNNCPQLSSYPKELFDTTKREYKLKKKIFTNLENLTIVTPSLWLASLVKKSFLSCYPISVINNGIDLDVFKPTVDKKIYDKYNIPKNKKIILGVANIWDKRKGLDDFVELSKIINHNYCIVMVGVNKEVKKILPDNVISIERTDNQEELAKIYTISDIFFNPSKEETFSLVTAEAIACGRPVAIYGNSAIIELVNKQNGIILDVNDNLQSNWSKVLQFLDNAKIRRDVSCITKFEIKDMINKYLDEYMN